MPEKRPESKTSHSYHIWTDSEPPKIPCVINVHTRDGNLWGYALDMRNGFECWTNLRLDGFENRESFSTLIQYRTDAVLKRSYTPACAGHKSQRGKIDNKPSKRSLQRLVFLLNNCDVPMTTMITLTMPPKVNDSASVQQHKDFLFAAIKRLRRGKLKASQAVWVREFQDNESVHWHIFTDGNIRENILPGMVDVTETDNWCQWMAKYYNDRGHCTAIDFKHMRIGNNADFHGCVRVERLFESAGGQYAGKEGAKRYQKHAPPKWDEGGRWWGRSGKITCTEIREQKVLTKNLDGCKIKTKLGEEIEVKYKNQFNRGVNGKRDGRTTNND